MKAAGAISTDMAPRYNGCITPIIRPMSWYSGTQPTLVELLRVAHRRADHFQIRQQIVVRHHDALRRGGRTRRVLQERHIVAICDRQHRQRDRLGASSIALTVSQSNPASRKRSVTSGRLSRSSSVVIAIFGEQSAMMAALESRAAVRRGTISGTAITPAARQPKNATMKSSPGGNRSTARSPGQCDVRGAPRRRGRACAGRRTSDVYARRRAPARTRRPSRRAFRPRAGQADRPAMQARSGNRARSNDATGVSARRGTACRAGPRRSVSIARWSDVPWQCRTRVPVPASPRWRRQRTPTRPNPTQGWRTPRARRWRIGQLQCSAQIGGAPRLDIRLGRVRGMLWHGCSVT